MRHEWNIFLEKECWNANRDRLILAKNIIPFLTRYTWPGNVRELHNLCLRWVLTVEDKVVKIEHLPARILNPENPETGGNATIVAQENLKTLNDQVIASVLEQTGGNISKAAKILGINRTTIYRRQKKTVS